MSCALAGTLRAWRRIQGPGNMYVFPQEDKAALHHDVWVRKNLAAACRRADVSYRPQVASVTTGRPNGPTRAAP